MHLTTVIGLDLSAAFDTVSHSILVQRIRDEFGVYGMSLACLQSYLADHHHYVKLSHYCSSTVQCKADIPQGSVLSLIHFASYISPVGQQRCGKLWAAGACATPTVTGGGNAPQLWSDVLGCCSSIPLSICLPICLSVFIHSFSPLQPAAG